MKKKKSPNWIVRAWHQYVTLPLFQVETWWCQWWGLGAFGRDCPKCEYGENDPKQGGSARCFHCDVCQYVECDQ